MNALVQERRDDIREIVCDILEIDSEELKDSSLLKEDHDADSLRAIEILAALEKTFGISIDQAEMARMVNLDGIYAVVAEAGEK
ncbi:acyl carrier protein [Streptomyces sp. 110]|uniref:Acyl carrier protein n=1 Tax=Streptomyces endocoffeicus TaxID=2898945 RepID=A0ABS1PX60_9ACTN|nr:acyl carrier protein [Streptomyces endocoffeicus]MBL1116864.1 acyl carrier protein [Streptomyces endocoffeicus]